MVTWSRLHTRKALFEQLIAMERKVLVGHQFVNQLLVVPFEHRLRTGAYRLQFQVVETREIVKVEKDVKGKKIEEEQELVHYKIIVEKAGHRDGFYDE